MSVKAAERSFDFRRLFSTISIGLVAGIIALPLVISFASLIYSGELSSFAPVGIGLMLFGCLVMQLIVTLTTSTPGLVGGPQDSPAAILGLAAAAIIAQMGSAPLEQKFVTVAATILVTSVLSGIAFILVGSFKLGQLIRFIPYPVVGGFIAGTGWLLVKGGLGVMLGTSLTMAHLDLLFSPGALMTWLPGALFGVLLLIVSRRFQHILTIPLMLVGGVLLFYLVTWASGYSLAQLREMGWLLGPFPQGGLWRPPALSAVLQVQWQVVAGQASNIAAAVLLSMVGLLLNTSALELVARKDIDLNRELVSTGFANIAGGAGGASVGFHYLGISTIPLRAGIFNRLVGVVSALVMGTALVLGAGLLSLFPTAVVGGLLFYVGLSFLAEWLYDAWFQLPHIDYALVLIILAVVGGVGFLQGILVGSLIAIILFVVSYSRIKVVKHELSGATFQSNLERPLEQRLLLRHYGEKIQILRLQGFIFFGTAQGLLNQVHQRAEDAVKEPLRFLLMDFQGVTSLDSSAIFSFSRLKQFAEAKNFYLVLTDLSKATRAKLASNGFIEGDQLLRFFPSLDYGMEWCEDKLLTEEGSSTIMRSASVHAQLGKMFDSPELSERFMLQLEKQELEPGQVLIRQGDVPDAMYFIDRGRLTAELEVGEGKTIRLKSMSGGTMIGEAGLYFNNPRSATVRADLPSVVYRLSADALKQMEEQEPRLAAGLHEWVARVLSERLTENNNTLAALLE